MMMDPRTAVRVSPKLVVDIIVLRNDELLLVKRKKEPFMDCWALPGGFVEYGERTEHAAIRELKEETGLTALRCRLFGIYSDPGRDPRGHIISVAYEIEVADDEAPTGGDDAAEAAFHGVSYLPILAFDHPQILRDYLARESTDRFAAVGPRRVLEWAHHADSHGTPHEQAIHEATLACRTCRKLFELAVSIEPEDGGYKK